MFQFNADMVRTLKGAPLSCLLILAIERQPVSAQYLERRTGYSDKSVNSALLLLGDMGMATRNARYQWQIANNATQLPLMNDLLPAPEEEPLDPSFVPTEQGRQNGGEQETEGVGEIPSRKNSESENFRVTNPKKAENDDKNPIESENFRVDCPSSSTRSINLESSKGLLDSRAETEKFRVDILAVLDEFGVGEPKRSQLAGQDWITSRIARYHLETCADVALAIWRIEHGWRVPKGWQPTRESPLPVQESQSVQDVPDDQAKAFARALECLRANIPPGLWATYAASMRLEAALCPPNPPGGGTQMVRIAVANNFVIQQMEPYRNAIVDRLSSEFGTPIEIEFVVR